MREIKFRIHDVRGKVVGYEQWDESVGWSHIILAEEPSDDGSHWVHSGVFPDEFPERNKRIQYIGRKDKNDKEIYGGDIVEIYYGNARTARIIVEFEEMVDGDGYSWLAWNINLDGEILILGNIYENPELIAKLERGG